MNEGKAMPRLPSGLKVRSRGKVAILRAGGVGGRFII